MNKINAVSHQLLASHLKDITGLFSEISFRHIFSELNVETDLLSKAGLALQPDKLVLLELGK